LKIIIEIIYLISSVLFIFGIKQLSSPKTARNGNFLSSLGMFIAIVVTLFDQHVMTYEYILIGLVIGSGIGLLFAYKTPMTGMPQMVGLLNGFGGGASMLVALSEFYKMKNFDVFSHELSTDVSVVLSIFIGAVTFAGSLIAFGKLQGIVSGKVIKYPLQNTINVILIVAVLIGGTYSAIYNPTLEWIILSICAIALILGVLLVLPIGGADMPVAISLLNSYSGIAGSMTGFVLKNNELIIAGALVGASGLILTMIMCKGMNRSLMNVLLGGWESAGTISTPSAKTSSKGSVKSVDPEELAMIFDAASNIIIVPGYGMAVAQAQHAVRDLVNLLESKGKNVRFAIHPVAGRMPGHMNVLLAEAQVSYEKMYAMEDINDDFNNTDIAFIIGANDVVNPAARHDKNSPIYGMPILNVDYSKTVIMNKRSMNAGYAGIDNELFFYPNTLMYFGDSKDAVNKLVHELKNI